MKINYPGFVRLAALISLSVAVHSNNVHARSPMPVASIDDSVIKVRTVAQGGSLRTALIREIWGVPWSDIVTRQPNKAADYYNPTADDALPDGVSGVDRVERVTTTLTEPQVTGADVVRTSTAFIYHPVAPNGRLVVVHQGHGCTFDGNLDATIRELVAGHYGVVAMRMPFFQRPAECGSLKDHDDLMGLKLRAGSPMKFFVEPVARVLNYVQAKHPIYWEFDMIGLSGGGWTTTLYAAIDPRIRKSFPVAGSIPLYLRDNNYNDDTEQYLASFYTIAGYKDLYVLGSFGSGRAQTQILNRYDSCCFGEGQHKVSERKYGKYMDAVKAYASDVQRTIANLKAGSFTLFVDTATHTHEIAIDALHNIILPGLAPDDETVSIERYNAIWAKTPDTRPAIWSWARVDFDKHEEEMENQGYRLIELNAFLRTGAGVRYNAIWAKAGGHRPAVWGWARADFDNQVAEMNDQGYQLVGLNAFVLPEAGERYNAIWAKAGGDRPAVWGWARADFDKKESEMEHEGYRLIELNTFVLPGAGERYNAIWAKTGDNRPTVWGWARADFDKQEKEMEHQGYRLDRLNAFVVPGAGERYNAIWAKTGDTRPAVWSWARADFDWHDNQLDAQGYSLVDLNAVVPAE